MCHPPDRHDGIHAVTNEQLDDRAAALWDTGADHPAGRVAEVADEVRRDSHVGESYRDPVNAVPSNRSTRNTNVNDQTTVRRVSDAMTMNTAT